MATVTTIESKQSPTVGPTKQTPQPEYLIAQATYLRGPLVRCHSIFDGYSPHFLLPIYQTYWSINHPIPTYGTLETHLPNISQLHFQRIMLLPSNIVSKVLRKNHRILVKEAKFSHESKAWKASQRIWILQTHPPPALSVPLSPSGLSASASTSAWRCRFQTCPRIGGPGS